MYIAMNRFRVKRENTKAFEDLWLSRDSYLKDLEGFVEFRMLKGSEIDGTVLYASHTVWASEKAFLNWTKSEAFRAAHKGAGQRVKLYEGSPNFEGFNTIQHIV
ncbi:antibiotic biosynthesis monooxygenase [Rhodobacteraceae bacterium Araon29]|jgi:heme-degrading monooxygenase HmoA|tara:strand:+ start:343 stop:654 length:312 start_codon:yes stop_codon:yes gene_type:complete